MTAFLATVLTFWSAYTDRRPWLTQLDLTNEEIIDELLGSAYRSSTIDCSAGTAPQPGYADPPSVQGNHPAPPRH